MGVRLGMRGKDLRAFMNVAKKFGVHLLVRPTNGYSLRFIQKDGYYPKPAIVKAKTAKINPPLYSHVVNNLRVTTTHDVAGLVVHPGFQPACADGQDAAESAANLLGAMQKWEATMTALTPALATRQVDLSKPETWAVWGQEQKGTTGWRWRVDIDPSSRHFGALQLRTDKSEWRYIHGDYDLKDVIVPGFESDNRAELGTIDGVPNATVLLVNTKFELIVEALNGATSKDLVQHGADAQFRGHSKEPIVFISKDFEHVMLYDGMTVHFWYESHQRKTLGEAGEFQYHHESMAVRLPWDG